MSVNTRMPNAKLMCPKLFSWAKNERKLFFDGRMEVERTAPGPHSVTRDRVTSPGRIGIEIEQRNDQIC